MTSTQIHARPRRGFSADGGETGRAAGAGGATPGGGEAVPAERRPELYVGASGDGLRVFEGHACLRT